jgi:uncharacterized protein with ATP-grasp and redox domains
MQTYLDCIPCFARQTLDASRHATQDNRKHELVMREVLRLASNLDMSQNPPKIGQRIHRLVRELTGIEDPYCEVKKEFNNAALKLYSKMRHLIIESKDPLETAVRLAIAGNIIDLGVKSQLRETDLTETVNRCLSDEIADMQLEAFRNAVNDAREILYITDNAGEIVFDRLLIEQLPIEKVTVAVKGSPVINDATMEDAIIAGLPRIVEVIANGSDAPGTILESCSQNFRNRFEKADLIIAKGQGNYETLSNVDKNIFFILKVKCQVIARDIGCEVGDMVFQKTKTFKGAKNAAI